MEGAGNPKFVTPWKCRKHMASHPEEWQAGENKLETSSLSVARFEQQG
jgi:hypothetical protein